MARKNSKHQRATLTVEEAAELIGIGRATAYAAVRNGELPSVKFGKRILVPRVALQGMLEGLPRNTQQ